MNKFISFIIVIIILAIIIYLLYYFLFRYKTCLKGLSGNAKLPANNTVSSCSTLTVQRDCALGNCRWDDKLQSCYDKCGTFNRKNCCYSPDCVWDGQCLDKN